MERQESDANLRPESPESVLIKGATRDCILGVMPDAISSDNHAPTLLHAEVKSEKSNLVPDQPLQVP